LIREPKLNYKLPIIRLQFPLAFDARVLSEVVSREVSLGKIVYGENYATLKVKTSVLSGHARKVDRQDWYAACQSLTSRPGSEPTLCRVQVSKPLLDKKQLKKMTSAWSVV